MHKKDYGKSRTESATMVLGFNHNILYKGEVFHVQTEDSGAANPHFITLLFRGGVILGSKKTSYADILRIENLEGVVEELMKEQHKEMMRRLKSGEFDNQAFGAASPAPVAASPVSHPAPGSSPEKLCTASPAPAHEQRSDISLLFEMPGSQRPVASVSPPSSAPPKNVVSLDDAILSFFGADEK